MGGDHRKLLSQISRQVDGFKAKDVYQNPPNFEEMKKKISAAMEEYSLLKLGLEYGRWLGE